MTTTIIASIICLLVGLLFGYFHGCISAASGRYTKGYIDGISFSDAKESELQDLKAQLAAYKPRRGAGGKFVSKAA